MRRKNGIAFTRALGAVRVHFLAAVSGTHLVRAIDRHTRALGLARTCTVCIDLGIAQRRSATRLSVDERALCVVTILSEPHRPLALAHALAIFVDRDLALLGCTARLPSLALWAGRLLTVGRKPAWLALTRACLRVQHEGVAVSAADFLAVLASDRAKRLAAFRAWEANNTVNLINFQT